MDLYYVQGAYNILSMKFKHFQGPLTVVFKDHRRFYNLLTLRYMIELNEQNSLNRTEKSHLVIYTTHTIPTNTSVWWKVKSHVLM